MMIPPLLHHQRKNEEVNLCLMAKKESETSSVSSNSSINFENCSQLLDAFKETHEEANFHLKCGI